MRKTVRGIKMLRKSFNAVVRIRLRIGLDINLDVTENYRDAIKAAVGVRKGNGLVDKVPVGTSTWTADGKMEATQFLNKLYEHDIVKDRMEDIQNKLRQLNVWNFGSPFPLSVPNSSKLTSLVRNWPTSLCADVILYGP